MSCFDRVGERAKLKNSIQAQTNICYVSGRSGVGKSQIITSVLESTVPHHRLLKYEFGRNPLTITKFLLINAIEQQPTTFKILESFRNIKLNELNINIPMVGKAPIKWASEELPLDRYIPELSDIFREIDGPIYAATKREVLRIDKLLHRTQIQVLWISNIEIVRNYELGLLFLVLKYISPNILIIVEGAHSESLQKVFSGRLSVLCEAHNLRFSEHNIKPFNEHFARGLFNYLGLAKKGFSFNYKNNLGYPVAIEFDLNEKSAAFGSKLENYFNENEQIKNTLLLLGLFFATENRYPKIIKLADEIGVELSLSELVKNGIVKLTDNLCELAHPQVARYITLTNKHNIFRLLNSFYYSENLTPSIEFDLAAMAYIDMFDLKLKKILFMRSRKYVLEQLSQNNISICDQILNLIGEGLESLSAEEVSAPEISKFCDSISLLKLQLDVILCRIPGINSNSNIMSPVELLLLAQVRMRLIDLKGAIALTEIIISKLTTYSISQDLESWLYFCAAYIKMSCLIALGDFSEYRAEYEKLQKKISTKDEKSAALFSLLPAQGVRKKSFSTSASPKESYLSARYNNNQACQMMTTNIKNKHIGQLLRSSIDAVVNEGSIEVTFPINNYGLYLMYNEKLNEAIDIFYSMIDHCTYPYDYFSSYHNLAIAMAMKGDIVLGLEYSEKAHKYILDGVLSDPVFAIKSHFNHSLLCYFNGKRAAWNEFKLIELDFEKLPTKYHNLLSKKITHVEKNMFDSSFFSKIQNENIELANALWPQNLQFWDFMYPIISSENINEVIELNLYYVE